MGLKLITAPANDPVSLDEAKAHLRVDFTDDDILIEAFIEAATDYVDGPKGFLGRALIQQTWDLYLHEFPHPMFGRYHGRHHFRRSSYIEVPLPPLISVGGVFYLDSSGVEQEMDDTLYRVDPSSEPGRISLAMGASWPQPQHVDSSVRIRFTAGYVDATNSPATDNVPRTIKSAILMHIGDLYANRETMVSGQRAAAVTLPWASEQLLRPHRVILSMA